MSKTWHMTPLLLLTAAVTCWAGFFQDGPISGPQLGDKLPALKATCVYEMPGESVDFSGRAEGKPLLLIFVNQLSRPGVSMTRALSHYAESRRKDGLQTAIIWVGKEKDAAENYLNQAKNSLAFESPVGILVEGDETSLAYGLNHQVPITVVVANEGKVAANFALPIPDIKDVRTISREIVKLIGGEPPSEESLRPKRN